MPAAAAPSASPSTKPAVPQQPQDDQRKTIIVHATPQVVCDPSSSANHAVQQSQQQQQLLQQQQPNTSRRNVVCSPVMPPETDTSTLFPLPPTKMHQPAHCTRNVEDTMLIPPPTPVARRIEFDDDGAQPQSTRVNINAVAPPPPAPCEPTTEANPVLEREIRIHQKVLDYRTFQLHNHRQRLLAEITFVDDQLRDVYDETQKYLNVQSRNRLQAELEAHYRKFKHNSA